MQSTALFLYGGGSLAFLVAAAVIFLRRRQVFEPASGLAAVLALSAWQATLAWNTVHPLPFTAAYFSKEAILFSAIQLHGFLWPVVYILLLQ